jgi:hypothetical protein
LKSVVTTNGMARHFGVATIVITIVIVALSARTARASVTVASRVRDAVLPQVTRFQVVVTTRASADPGVG